MTLYKVPKKPIILEGFPGIGLVASIATEYLIDHLNAEMIGKIFIKNMPPLVAIHNKQLVQPFGVFYAKAKNLVLIHGLTMAQGFEWELAEDIIELAEETEAQHIISIEGVPSQTENPHTFFYTTDKGYQEELKKIGAEQLENGIVLGVTSSLLIKNDSFPQTCLFVETQIGLPDSKSAALIIKDLNNLLGLKVDVKPLLSRAKEFEKKLNNILSSAKNAYNFKKQKEMNYVG